MTLGADGQQDLDKPSSLLMCGIGDHKRYVVPGLAIMAVGQQIPSRRHIRQVEFNLKSNVAVADISISLSRSRDPS